MANALLTKDQTPTLDFADVSGALEYWAQIAADPRFSTITHQQAGLATSVITPTTNLTDAKKYYWRFRARTSATLTADASVTDADGTGYNLRDDATHTGLGQTFKPLKSLPLKRVTLPLKKVGSPVGNVWVEIWTTSGGTPSAQTGTDSAVIAAAGLTTSFADKDFDFTTPIPLVAGTTYAIVLQGDFAVSGANYVVVNRSSSNSYSDGAPFKHDAGVVWTSGGTLDQDFTISFHSWLAWSPIWSFWLDTTAEAAVTPTAWTLVDPDETTDTYTFAVAPHYDISEPHVRRGYEHNIQGDLLTEYISTRARLSLDFNEAYVKHDQAAEILRFYHKRKAVYLMALTDYQQDTWERVWKVEFAEEPVFRPLAPGREDYFVGSVELEEAGLT